MQTQINSQDQVVTTNVVAAAAVADAVAAFTVGLNDSVQVAPAKTEAKPAVGTRERIAALVAERKVWEIGAFYKSNVELYALLGKCYALYAELSGNTKEAKAARIVLNEVISTKGYTFNESTHGLTKLVKYVFEGVDRRRVSAYSLVLREALAQNVKADGIPAFITNGGGVEEIRRSKSKTAKTPAQKAALGKQAVAGQQLAVITSDTLAAVAQQAGNSAGDDVVAICTMQADGSFVVRALVKSKTVMSAVMGCAYSASKAVVKTDSASTEAANDDKTLDDLLNDAA